MKRHKEKYDIVVVGGGHAGIEAALISANLGLDTLLISMDEKSIGRTSCNPAIGGLAKGQMVKEVDVLGGVMGFLLINVRFKAKPLTSPRVVQFGRLGLKLINLNMRQWCKNI